MPSSRSFLLVTAALASASACSGGGGASTSSSSAAGGSHTGGADAGVVPLPGADRTVTVFDRTPVYFTGNDNRRTVDATASFPKDGVYQSILLHLSLDCPKDGCDPWDRLGTLGVVTAKAEDGGTDTVVEVARFITPYHVGASWDIDLTPLRPILAGDLTLRAFIDTWVGPGSQYGGGWLLSASFEMKGGVPSPLPVAVVPVWLQTSVPYGDPAKPMDASIPPKTITLPQATSFTLRSFITGHGQGNADNCAEFCARDHTLRVGAAAHVQHVWRDDCATTAAPGQQGTYKLARAGWCPGADVKPWDLDVTADIPAGAPATFAYEVEAYVNTCRPDATPCAGCTLGTGCAYDGSTHTEPFYAVSTLLIAFQ